MREQLLQEAKLLADKYSDKCSVIIPIWGSNKSFVTYQLQFNQSIILKFKDPYSKYEKNFNITISLKGDKPEDISISTNGKPERLINVIQNLPDEVPNIKQILYQQYKSQFTLINTCIGHLKENRDLYTYDIVQQAPFPISEQFTQDEYSLKDSQGSEDLDEIKGGGSIIRSSL